MYERDISDADIGLYSDLMVEVKGRLMTARDCITAGKHRVDIEFGALQLRTAIELTMLSSLITSRAALAQAEKALSRKDAEDAKKLVTRIHPNHWPVPPHAVGSDPELRRHAAVVTEGPAPNDYLRADEFGPAIGATSRWLHAPNPYAAPLALEDGRRQLSGLLMRTFNLLEVHTRKLVNANRLLLCQLDYDRRDGDDPFSGNVWVAVATRRS